METLVRILEAFGGLIIKAAFGLVVISFVVWMFGAVGAENQKMIDFANGVSIVANR